LEGEIRAEGVERREATQQTGDGSRKKKYVRKLRIDVRERMFGYYPAFNGEGIGVSISGQVLENF